MKNKILRTIRRKGLLIWITAVAMCMISFISFAEYQSESYMKRVVVSSSDQGMMFSSNYLVEGGENTYQPKPELVNSSNDYDVNVYLWNYSLKNTAQCYPGEIDYTVSLRITDVKGVPITDASVFSYTEPDDPTTTLSRSITVRKAITNNGTTTYQTKKVYDNSSDLSSAFTFTDSIEDGAGSAKQTQYLVTFENWDLDANKNICVQIIAKPDRTKHKDLHDIAAVIGLKEAVDEESNDWKASISEIQDQRTDVDGYNLVLTGSGKAEIVLRWDTTKIDVNKYFLYGNTIYDFHTGTPNERVVGVKQGDIMSVTINANSGEYRNRYNIQLYLTGSVKPEDNTFFAEVNSEGASSAWITYEINSIS